MASAMPAGCMLDRSRPTGTAAGIRVVRAPALGQFWKYTQLDLVTGALVNRQVDRISSIGPTVGIDTTSEQPAREPRRYPAWGAAWLQRYAPPGEPDAAPPTEIQSPWGMIVLDPHWGELQAYREPIPLWPQELHPGWSRTIDTAYITPESPDDLPWQLTMHAHAWESIKVPAGRFTALRFNNLIDFRYTNVSEKVAAQRLETVWFVPEIGRWAARESFGTYYQDVGERIHENSYRWELQAWA